MRKQARRMADCCQGTRIAVRSKKKPVLVLDSCRHRLCPHCSKRRSWSCARSIEHLGKEMDSPRFITLTLRTQSDTLAESLERLRSGWKRLRQTKLWKSKCEGGVYSLEVTRGRSGDRWHPHLHILVDGSFIPQRELSDAWLKATGDSCIVDVRAVRSRRQIARYVSKYVAKGDEFASWTLEQIAEYAQAMCGQRVIQTFGSLHGKVADPREEVEIDARHHQCISWGKIERYAREGFGPANRVYEIGPRCGVMWRVLTGRDADDDPWLRVQPVGPDLRELNEALAECVRRSKWEMNNPGRSYTEHVAELERLAERRRRTHHQLPLTHPPNA
jgi:hypothetical protein